MENVYSLNQKNIDQKSIKEFESILNALPYMTWETEVQAIIKLIGVPLNDELMNESKLLPFESTAYKLGHETISDVITRNGASYGFEKSWDDWSQKVKAFRYRSFYQIHNGTPQEIIEAVNGTTKLLGREPINSMEFVDAKEQMYRVEQDKINSKYKEESEGLHFKIHNNEKTINRLKQEIEVLNLDATKHQDRENDLLNRIHDAEVQRNKAQDELSKLSESYNKELFAQKRRYEETIRQIKDEHKTEVNKAEEQNSLSRRQEVSSLKASHNLHIRNLESELGKLQGHLEEMVSHEQYAKMSQENESLRNTMKGMVTANDHQVILNKNVELKVQLDDLKSNLDEHQALLATIDSLEKNIAFLESKIKAQGMSKGVFGSEELDSQVKDLESKVLKLESNIRRAITTSVSWKERAINEKAKYKKIMNEHKMACEQIGEMKNKLHRLLKKKNKLPQLIIASCISTVLSICGTYLAIHYILN